MSKREMESAPTRWRAALAAAVLGATTLVAGPASAYVVVTIDNRVYDVPTRPEVNGDLVLFTVEGIPVALRVYDVNVRKTNEINGMLDQGATSGAVAAQLRAMPSASTADERLIVSSRLHRIPEERFQPGTPDYRLLRRDVPPQPPSYHDQPGRQEWTDRDRPTRRRLWGQSSDMSSFSDEPGRPEARRESPFAQEARRAMEEARRRDDPGPRVVPERAAPPPSGRPTRHGAFRGEGRREAEPAREPMREAMRETIPERRSTSSRSADRVAELDAEIAAEQEYLQQLTSGDITVDDLDRAIQRSMDKIDRLQHRRDRMSRERDMDVAAGGAADYEPTGRWPAGSREARWEQDLQAARQRLERLRQQQAGLPAGASDEREMIDEFIGEAEHDVRRLTKRLEEAEGR